MFEVIGLRKSYDSQPCLEEINFKVSPGEIVALLGPNGAGKTTTIKCILNLLKFDSGQILFNSISLHLQKSQLGCTPQESDFPGFLSSLEVLEFVTSHYESARSISDLSTKFELQKFLHKPVNQLSGGQKRALGLACAFAGQPKLVVLDEPSVGLDSEVRTKIWRQIKQLASEGVAILITSHQFDEIEQLADRILVLNKGKIIKQGKIADIKRELGFMLIEFHSKIEKKILDIDDYEIRNGRHRIVTKNADQLVKQIVKEDYSHLQITALSLEEVFIKILKGQS